MNDGRYRRTKVGLSPGSIGIQAIASMLEGKAKDHAWPGAVKALKKMQQLRSTRRQRRDNRWKGDGHE